MNTDREELSRIRQALVSRPASPAADAGEACPDSQHIWQAARGELAPGQVAELVDHTLACADCAMAWQLAVELDPETVEDRATETAPAWFRLPSFRWPPLRLSWAWGAPLAAAAAVLLLVALPGLPGRDETPPVFRQAESTGLESSLDGATLPRNDFVLRWSYPEEGTTFSIRISTEDLDTLDEASGLEVAEYRVPAAVLAGVPAGAKLLWHVEPELPGGAEEAVTFESFLE